MAAGWDHEAEAPPITASVLIVGAPGQYGSRYYYAIRSRDASGNEHESSIEVSAVAGQLPTPTSTSVSTVTPNSTRTPTMTVTPAATPTQAVVSPTVEIEKRIYLPTVIAE